MSNPFRYLSKFEWLLWIVSLATVTLSYILSYQYDVLTLIASLIGVTALIFVAKGMVLGQLLTVVFALFYGYISYQFTYYGEMITYLFMTAPIAAMAVISWIRHPYKESEEVEVNNLSKKQLSAVLISSITVTILFYFILKSLNNASLIISTLSITTSFIASALTFFRSPFYALAYAANDVVLIALWIIATIRTPSYLPMVLCFVTFFVNDIYGYVNWTRIKKRQQG